MAFDFVSYINTILINQYAEILIEQTVQQRNDYLNHLIALTLDYYIQQFNQDSSATYAALNQQPMQLIAQAEQHVQQTIKQHLPLRQHFATIEIQLSTLIILIAQQINHELRKLDNMSGLGVSGIYELLQQQYVEMQPLLSPWVWQVIHPSGVSIDSPIPSTPAVDAQTISSEFNRIIHQQMPAQSAAASPLPSDGDSTLAKPNPIHKHKKAIFLLLTFILLMLSAIVLRQSYLN